MMDNLPQADLQPLQVDFHTIRALKMKRNQQHSHIKKSETQFLWFGKQVQANMHAKYPYFLMLGVRHANTGLIL